MSKFKPTLTEDSVAYCLFHGGFVGRAEFRRRECVRKKCVHCVVITERAEATKEVQRYTGRAEEFVERFGALLQLGRRAEVSDDDEPGATDGKRMVAGEILRNARYANERRRKQGKKGSTTWKERRRPIK